MESYKFLCLNFQNSILLSPKPHLINNHKHTLIFLLHPCVHDLIMPVDVLISPRISFSHDVDLSEDDPSVPGEIFLCSSSTSIEADFDFAFSVDRRGGLTRESSTADELFSDGKLLPASINFATCKDIDNAENLNLLELEDCSASPVSPYFGEKQGSKDEKKIIKSLKEHLEDSTDFEDEEDEAEESEDETARPQETVSRAFWKFRRSSSLSVGKYGRNRGKQSVPSKLNVLSRSKSTGLLRKTVETEKYEDSKPGLPTLMEDERSFWKFKRSNSLDCQNRGGLIGSLRVKIQRSNSTGEQLSAKTASMESRQFRIRRSSSLNCNGNSRQSSGMIIGRSKSTGSAYTEKRELLKQNSARSSCSSSSSSVKKGQRQGRRSFKDYYANFYRGERANPVLNIPSPYISRVSVDLLGFSSLFCNGRYRKKRK